MSQIVLVIHEPWHHKPHGGVVKRGHVITDPHEIAEILATRPHHVIKRMSHPHEDEAIVAIRRRKALSDLAALDADELSAD